MTDHRCTPPTVPHPKAGALWACHCGRVYVWRQVRVFRHYSWCYVRPDTRSACGDEVEVFTLSAGVATLACNKRVERHGRWHGNRSGVKWAGRFKGAI